MPVTMPKMPNLITKSMPNLKIQKPRFFIDFLLHFDYMFDFLIKIRFVSQSAICIVPRNKKRHKHKHRSCESSILFSLFWYYKAPFRPETTEAISVKIMPMNSRSTLCSLMLGKLSFFRSTSGKAFMYSLTRAAIP